jgi:hypothetical protein
MVMSFGEKSSQIVSVGIRAACRNYDIPFRRLKLFLIQRFTLDEHGGSVDRKRSRDWGRRVRNTRTRYIDKVTWSIWVENKGTIH